MLSNIQVLRGVSALCVVVFHTVKTAESYVTEDAFLFSMWIDWGYFGVDIFFVISGFIMVVATHDTNVHPTKFAIRRLVRVVPLYWSFTFVFFLLLFCFPSLFNEMILEWTQVWRSFLFLTLSEHYDPLIFVGWTLEFEIIFYAIFSIAMFISNRPIRYCSAIVGVIAIAQIMQSSIMLEFMFGIVVGIINQYLKQNKPLLGKFLVTASLLYFLLTATSLFHPHNNSIDRVIAFGLPASVLVYGCSVVPSVYKNIATKLGDASYSIYLVQVFTIPAYFKIANYLNIGGNPDISIIICVAITAIVGDQIYRLFELPIHKRLKALVS